MPVYTWLMARSTDETPEDPEIRLDGWMLSFPSRPRIQPKELPEDQSFRSLTGSSSETWTPGEPIAIERKFHLNHSKFLDRTGLTKGTMIRLGVKWRVDSRSAAGYEGRLVTLCPEAGETTEIVKAEMDGSRLGGTVLVSTPITLHSIPQESISKVKVLAAREPGQILWRGLDRSREESQMKIILQGEGARFPIRCVNRRDNRFSYWVEWSHIPKGPISLDIMSDFLKRDPRSVFRVVVNTATLLGKTLMGNSVQDVDLVRRCWAHEIAGLIAQKLFYLCQKLDDDADQKFTGDELKKMFNHSGAANMGNILAGFIEVMKPTTMTGRANCPRLKNLAEDYFTKPEEFVQGWQSRISTGAARS